MRFLLVAGLFVAGGPVPEQEPPHPVAVATRVVARSDDSSRWTLVLAVRVPQGLHVYARTGAGYEAISVRLDARPGMKAAEAVWPEPSDLLFALSQPVKVHEGTVQAVIDVQVPAATARAIRRGRPLAIEGTLRYQACTDEACYKAREMRVAWSLPPK